MNRQYNASSFKGVGYFHHFPKNFLRPYGAADLAPSKETIFKRTWPTNCEWLKRPDVAVSELYSTIEENKDIIRGIPNVLTQGRIESLLQDLEPIMETLKKFHKGSVLPVNTNDSAELILKFINMNPETLESIKKFVHVGGALFSTGIQVLVAHTNLTNPGEMASKISFAPEPEPKFKTTGSINDLLPLLLRKSTIAEEKPPQVVPQQANLLQELKDQLMQILTAEEPENMKRKLQESEEQDEPMKKKPKKKKRAKNEKTSKIEKIPKKV